MSRDKNAVKTARIINFVRARNGVRERCFNIRIKDAYFFVIIGRENCTFADGELLNEYLHAIKNIKSDENHFGFARGTTEVYGLSEEDAKRLVSDLRNNPEIMTENDTFEKYGIEDLDMQISFWGC